MAPTCFVISKVVFVIIIRYIDIIVIQLVLRLPGHLVLLLQSSSCISEPRTHLNLFLKFNNNQRRFWKSGLI